MTHVKSYIQYHNPNQSGLIEGLNQAFSLESLAHECRTIDQIESLIPFETRFEIELRSILEGKKDLLLSRYRLSSSKGNPILESVLRDLPSGQVELLREKSKEFIQEFQSLRVNEQASIPTSVQGLESEYGKDLDNVLQNIKSTTDLPSTDSDSGIFSILKNILKAVTEDGSPIGIFQFILDIVGLVGDAFGPVGLIADMLNALIYAIRWFMGGQKDDSMMWLALLSFIGAFIPFGGSALSMMVKGSKAGRETLEIITRLSSKGGTATIDSATRKLITDAAPESIKALQYIAKSTDTALNAAAKLMEDFFGKFLTAATGWLPVIGGPLKGLFTNVGKMFRVFQSKAQKLARDIPRVMDASHVDEFSDFFKAASKKGARITSKGDDLIVTTSKGTKTLKASTLRGADLIKSRFGGTMGSQLEKKLAKANVKMGEFYLDLLQNAKRTERVLDAARGVIKLGGKTIGLSGRLALFMGKEIIKITGEDPLNISDAELEAFGYAAINGRMKDLLNKRIEEDPNIAYTVPYMDAIEDQESVDILNNTLNAQAEKFGLPEITDVVYYKNKDGFENLPQDIQDFFNGVYDEDPEALERMKVDKFLTESRLNLKSPYIESYYGFTSRRSAR